MAKFKVGDIVRCITARDKDIGRVINVNDEMYLNLTVYEVETKDYIYCYLRDSDLELVNEKRQYE